MVSRCGGIRAGSAQLHFLPTDDHFYQGHLTKHLWYGRLKNINSRLQYTSHQLLLYLSAVLSLIVCIVLLFTACINRFTEQGVTNKFLSVNGLSSSVDDVLVYNFNTAQSSLTAQIDRNLVEGMVDVLGLRRTHVHHWDRWPSGSLLHLSPSCGGLDFSLVSS